MILLKALWVRCSIDKSESCVLLVTYCFTWVHINSIRQWYRVVRHITLYDNKGSNMYVFLEPWFSSLHRSSILVSARENEMPFQSLHNVCFMQVWQWWIVCLDGIIARIIHHDVGAFFKLMQHTNKPALETSPFISEW